MAESLHALPLGNGAPALDAIVPRDLRATGQRAQFREREELRLSHHAGDGQSVIGEPVGDHRLVFVGARIGRAVAAKLRRAIRLRELLRHRLARGDGVRGARGSTVRRRPARGETTRSLRQPVAAGQEHRRRSRRGASEKAAARRADSLMDRLRCHAIAAGDHRPQVVPESGDDRPRTRGSARTPRAARRRRSGSSAPPAARRRGRPSRATAN